MLRAFLFLTFLLIFPAAALSALQDNPVPRVEITSVDSSQMPTVTLSANVYDTLGQPVLGLSAADFELTGDLASSARIVSVENITDDNLPFAIVLMIDVSTSMESTPMDNARLAAQAFLDNIGPNDPVAIMTFGSSSRLVQDYTTDKALLSAAIAGLNARGETALYQGAYDAIEVAAASPTPRRAVILLSDGGEYGGRSQVARGDAAALALSLGVPVYTIGLGYGIDRTFLNELSSATSSQYYESPTPEELTQIYTDLAAKLRSQYVITLETDLPLDGTQYTLGLRANTPQGSAEASAVLRAPIPVPILQLAPLSAPLTEPTEIRATLLADDPVESVIFRINDDEPVTTSAESPAISIDPLGYLPGDYLLTVTATDEDGDAGSAVLPFIVAALPSQISLSPDPSTLGEITSPQTLAVSVTGQTVATDVTFAFDDAEPTALNEDGSLSIDPLAFAPGEHALTVSVTNEGGVTSDQSASFSIGAVTPLITVSGLEDGQTIDAPLSFSVEVAAQGEVTPSVSLNEVLLTPDASGSYTIDPLDYPPGSYTLNVTASDTLTGAANVDFSIAALAPQIALDGLEAGETLSADRTITPSFISQTPVVHLAVFVDGSDLAHLVNPPFDFTIRVLDFPPGEHVLRLIADDSAGTSGTLEVPFSIGAAPAATATQAAVITATQQAQATNAAVATATQIAAVTATQQAQATQVAVQNITQVAAASATSAAESTQAQAAVLAAQATDAALATQAVRATATQQAVDAAASQEAAAEATQSANNATATQQSVNAEATQSANNALATQQSMDTAATQSAAETAEALAAEATATQQAQATSAAIQAALDQQATATRDGQLTATQAAGDTAATESAATAAAEAAQSAAATATQDAANATATSDAQALSASQATATQAAQSRLNTQATAQAVAQASTRDALATSNAESRQQAQATQNARATRNALATETAALNATATEQARATEMLLQETQAITSATEAAQETLAALEATATSLIVEATQTRNALETQTADEVTATQAALSANATVAAQDAQSTQAALEATATSNAAATVTRAAPLTATAQVIVQAAQATADASATAFANAAATDEQATLNAGATATSVAQSTLETRQTAVGPTATQPAGSAEDVTTTPPAQDQTPTPQPTLTEVQTGEAAAASNLTPIAIILIVIIIIIIVLVLIMRGRGDPGMRR